MARRNNNQYKRSNNKSFGNAKTSGGSQNIAINEGSQSNPLIQTVANLPFSTRIGDTLKLGTNMGSSAFSDMRIPGVMALDFYPTIGVSSDWTSAINRAASDEYAYVVHMNSRNTSYEAADLMQYYITVSSLYMFHSWMRRAYLILLNYSSTNVYMPDYLYKAMGFPSDVDTSWNMADFLTYINIFAAQIQRYRVPGKFNLLPTWVSMVSNVYLDAENPDRAQTYVFNPKAFLKYEPYTDTHGGKLVYKGYEITTLDSLKSLGTELLNSVENNEDIGTMMGDVEKAYGTENCWTVSLLTNDMTLSPVYDEAVLHSIECASISGTMTSLDISQADGVIKFGPCITQPFSGFHKLNWLLNADHVLTADEVYDRLKFSNSYAGFFLTNCGPAVVSNLRIYNDPVNGTYISVDSNVTKINAESAEAVLNLVHGLTKFSNYPWHYFLKDNGTDEKQMKLTCLMGDIDTYAPITSDIIDNIQVARNMNDVGFGSTIYTKK